MKPSKVLFQKCLIEVEQVVNNAHRTVNAQRRLGKHKHSFSNLPFEEQILIWDYIWKQAKYDSWTKLQPFFYCERFTNRPKELLFSWKIIKTWQDYVADWGKCDALAKLYTKILELVPEKVLPLLEQWNHSPDQWKRRQSVVSLLYFQRTKKKFLPFITIIRLIDHLINDKEYYVQKGVGWSLKELYQVYPKLTLAYLKKNIKKIKPEAFSHTIEKLTLKEKREIKRLRTL